MALNNKISKAGSTDGEEGGFLDMVADGKSALDSFQAKLASVLPAIPGQPAGKFQDISIGIDFHPTMFPPSPLMAVPHVGMVFDILGAIFAAINSVVPPAPEPEFTEEGELIPQPINVSSVAVAIVQAMAPSVLVNNKFIANAGISIQHLPGVVLHALPSVVPMASSEMFMGSSTVMADGAPFSYQFLPALSCNLIGMPAPFRIKKPKAKVSLMAPTAALINVIPGGMPVLVGGPPTIDLFSMAIGLGLKGMGKLWKKGGGKLQKHINKISPKNPSKAKRLQKLKCKLFGEPVDAATGRVFAENVDFNLPGPIPLEWSRFYFSDGEIASPIGTNWHHSYHMGYWEMDNGFITLLLEDSREIVLPALHMGDSFFHRKEGITWFKNDQGQYGYKNANGLTYYFNPNSIDNNLFPISTIKNELGNTIQFFYKKGILSEIIDSAGRIITVLSKKGRITEVFTKNEGEKVTLIQYNVDQNDNLTKVINANGTPKIFKYHKHLLVQLTNQSGLNFYWEYEGEGVNAKCIHTWGDEGILEYWTQYENGKTITTNSLGHSTTYYYDQENLIYRITDARGGNTYQEYNTSQELVLITDPVGNTTKYNYDSKGNLVSLQNANGDTTVLEYNANNKLIATRTPGGLASKWEYDTDGKLVARRYPDGSTTKYTYVNNILNTITDDLGNQTKLTWNTQGDLERINLQDGRFAVWYYNDLGQLQKHIDVKGSTSQYTYDLLGNITQLKEADNLHRFTYDSAENLIRATDNNRDVSFTYWGLGNLKSRKENKKTIYFNYNTEEQLTAIVNEKGEAYRFSLDPLGQIASEWGFDGLQRRYIRDRAGRVIKVLRPDERYTSYMYDGVGNILAADHYDGTGEYFAYNPDGRLLEATNAEATVQMKYNGSGNLIEEIQNGHSVKSNYNRLGNRTKITSSLGANILQEFDTNGQLSRIEALSSQVEKQNTQDSNAGGGNTWQATFERDQLGLEISRMVQGGNGTAVVNMQTDRDKKGRVTHQSIQSKNLEGSTQGRSVQYTWSSGDRLRNTIDQLTGKKVDYSYDQEGSLLSASYKGGTETIYKMPDAVGNLFKTKGRKDRTYGKGGKLLKDDKASYRYDAEGNLSLKQTLKGDEVYSYFGNGMLKDIVKPNGKEISFEYDALGRRTAKIYNKKITRFVYDGNVLLHEWEYNLVDRPKLLVNATGFVETDAEEPIDPNKLVTWVFEHNSFVPAAKIVNGATYSIACDHLGTPVQAYDQTGTKVWERQLDIYGATKQEEGRSNFIPFLYQGQYYDEETELAYNRFRYYSPDTGTYVSQDPIGLRGNNPNFYAYVKDSNGWVDVLGLEGGIVTILLQEGGSHFGIITDGVGGMQTDLNQLGDLGAGTNDYAKIMKDSDLYVFDKYLNVEVGDLDAAKKMQLEEISRGKFKYHKFNDSCLTHVAKVLQSGGEDIDSKSIKSQIKYMREREGKFKKLSCG